MTISSNVSSVTRNGNGVATSFSFPFKVWDTSQLQVYLIDADGKATLTTNWTATLSDPGGNVAYPTSGSPLPTGQKLVIMRAMPFTQLIDLVNATAFDPEVIESELDVLTAMCQQLSEAIGRSVKVDPGTTDPGAYLAEIRAAVTSASADADDAETARIAAEVARDEAVAASENVSVLRTPPITAAVGQTVITPGFTWNDAAGNIIIYIDGFKQATDTYTLASPNITLSDPLTGGEIIEVYSVQFDAAPSTPLYADNNGSDIQNKPTFRSNLGVKAPSEVTAYTKQQYATPVAVTPSSGAVTLDAELHQDCAVTSTQNLTMNAPTKAVNGMHLFIRLYAASALTITWNAVFKANADASLPTAHVAGKATYCNFRFNGASWVLLGLATEA